MPIQIGPPVIIPPNPRRPLGRAFHPPVPPRAPSPANAGPDGAPAQPPLPRPPAADAPPAPPPPVPAAPPAARRPATLGGVLVAAALLAPAWIPLFFLRRP